MGQAYSLTTLPAGSSALETADLTDLTFEKPLGGARFLRTVRARHRTSVVVAKVCAKTNASVSFKPYVKALKIERERLRGIWNVLPYEKVRETATLGVLVRQYVHSSLYDRVSMRPFLEGVEKKWVAFQLLCAVRDCHDRGVFHGDIKSENVLVTSWGWVYLTDFASAFKPVYLPEDNPADFSFYYDTSARRTCYLAPERFYAAGEKPGDEVVHWNMDIFSLGCVLAELFTEAPTFTLSQLFKYRKGDYDPELMLLNKVEDEHVRALISSMIKRDPEERWHAQDYLDEFKGKAFPLCFYQHLHTLMQEVTDPSSGRKTDTADGANNGMADDRIDRVYGDFDLLSVSLGYEDVAVSARSKSTGVGTDVFPLQIDLPNSRHTADSRLVDSGDNATFILLTVIVNSMRSAARASSKIRGCELLLAFAERVPDEAKLDRILPYVMPLLDDPNEMVLVTALRTMTQLLALVTVTSPVNSFVFTQYIFPRLQNFVSTRGFKQNHIVRATYAACLASLAETASRFLDMMQALRASGSLPTSGNGAEEELDGFPANSDAYDSVRLELLDQFEGQTKVFLTDNDTAVRRAFLSSVATLCVFFGEARASDVLLSHLNTYLNDPDWQLKCAFFKTIVGVAVYVGGASLEDFILPLMLQALTDPQEFVIEQALRSLASMAELGLLQRTKTWELIDTVARFEMHPNMWVKEAAAHFVSAATTYLSMADVRILVAPLVKPYLKVPVSNLSEVEVLDALKKPLPRAVLDLALQWAGKVDKSAFWQQAKESKQLSYRAGYQMPPVSSVAELGPKSMNKVPKTDEDEQWLGRLRNAGMRNEDEVKILAFREYLWRAGQRGKKDQSPGAEAIYDQIVSLTKLQVTPQTVIFENDVELYKQHAQEQDQRAHDLVEAIEEATRAAQRQEEARAPQLKPILTEAGDEGNKNVASGQQAPLKLPGLKRQSSATGQSLSSSPSSGINLLGKDMDRKLKHRSSAAGLLAGTGKSAAEVATDGTMAAGKLDAPTSSSRRTSPQPKSPARKRNQAKPNRSGHNYAGNDPTVLKLLDTVYVDNFPADAADFGPLIKPLKRGPIPTSTGRPPSGPWRPQGQLVAVLGEHTAKVNRIVVSPDHLFFVTGSEDGTVRVWDTSRIENNVSHRSRFKTSLGEGVKVTSLCFIDCTYSFVCTGSDGSVHFIKVLVSESEHGPRIAQRYEMLRSWQIPDTTSTGEHAVWCEHFRGENASTLVLATSHCRILALGLRDMSLIFTLQNPAQHGKPTTFCISRKHDWLLLGTSHGVLALWDLRFRLRLRSWAFPSAKPITRLQLHPSRKTARRNRVCVTGGTAQGEVTVWDVEKLICHEVFRPATPAHTNASTRLNPRAYDLISLDDDRAESLLTRITASLPADASRPQYPTTNSSSFALLHTADSDAQHPVALTGSADGSVRFWDCERVEGCRVVSGPNGAHADEDEAGAPKYEFVGLGLDTKVLVEKLPEAAESAPEADFAEPTSEAGRRIGGGGGDGGGVSAGSGAGGKMSRFETIRQGQRRLLGGHLDAVTDVVLVERPFGMVVSADRAGMVFVFQ